jgi:predicted ATP-grasp superfamily ATP-dependent carboligase
LNLLIIEYMSGGGYVDQKLSSSILSEGYSMLQSLITDCKTAGHNITTFLDSRLVEFNPSNNANQTIAVSTPKEFVAKLEDLSGVADAVYVIAPESGQVLENLVENVESSGGTSLNCETEAIRQVSNKITACQTMKQKGLKIPETVLVGIHENVGNIKRLTKELGYPMVFKPLDGVSCSGLSVVKDEQDITEAVKKVARESMSKHFIAQEAVSGEAASACVISNGYEAVAVTLNRQFVTLASPYELSGYYGGAVPFSHSLENEALRAAEWAVESVGGLKGYVGVDMILTDEKPVVLEVNPRLTMSYVGLRLVAEFNPAEAIIDAVTRQRLPKSVHTRGYSFFSKVEVPSRRQILEQTYQIEEVVSPPFPIEDRSAYALVTAVSTSPKEAEKSFRHTKRRLLNLYRGD